MKNLEDLEDLEDLEEYEIRKLFIQLLRPSRQHSLLLECQFLENIKNTFYQRMCSICAQRE